MAIMAGGGGGSGKKSKPKKSKPKRKTSARAKHSYAREERKGKPTKRQQKKAGSEAAQKRAKNKASKKKGPTSVSAEDRHNTWKGKDVEVTKTKTVKRKDGSTYKVGVATKSDPKKKGSTAWYHTSTKKPGAFAKGSGSGSGSGAKSGSKTPAKAKDTKDKPKAKPWKRPEGSGWKSADVHGLAGNFGKKDMREKDKKKGATIAPRVLPRSSVARPVKRRK